MCAYCTPPFMSCRGLPRVMWDHVVHVTSRETLNYSFWEGHPSCAGVHVLGGVPSPTSGEPTPHSALPVLSHQYDGDLSIPFLDRLATSCNLCGASWGWWSGNQKLLPLSATLLSQLNLATACGLLVCMHWPPRGTAIDAHAHILVPLVCMRWLPGPLAPLR